MRPALSRVANRPRARLTPTLRVGRPLLFAFRLIPLILVTALFLVETPSLRSAAQGAFIEQGGLLVVEAENYETKTGATAPGFTLRHDWEFRTDVSGYSGTGFMQVLPDERPEGGSSPSSPADASGAEMVYSIKITTAGTYNVWVRGYAMGSESNGVHIGVDGSLAGTGPGASNMSGFKPPDVWHWEDGRKAGYAQPATLTLTTGTHTLHVWQRDDAFRLDKIVLTTSSSAPTGAGPLESLRDGSLRGQIIGDPNSDAYLVYNRDSDGDGKLDPFFMAGAGDPEGFLFRGDWDPATGTRINGDQMDIIGQMRQFGGNGIYLMALRTHGGDGFKDTSDSQFSNPFINGDATNLINPNILDQWDTWFTAMDNAGIVIYFFFYDDNIKVSSTLGWPLDGAGNLHPKEQYFIETLVNRFKKYNHLIWMVMEEVSEMGGDYIAHAAAIASTIRANDEFNHVIGTHQTNGDSFDFANNPLFGQFGMQRHLSSQNPVDYHNAAVSAVNKAAGRYNVNFNETDPSETNLVRDGKRTTLRKVNWARAMGGAYFMVYGTWNPRSSIGGGPPSPDMLTDMRRVQQFFESTNFNEMAPHDELGFGGTQYVLANPGDSYIAYASALSGDIGVKGMTAGSYDFKWFDAASGNTIVQTAVAVAAGDQTWSTPVGIGNELALHIRPTGAGQPPGVNFPGATWESRTPVELGMDGARLDQFAANVGGKGVIIKDGYVVKSWGDQTGKSQWHSAGKPVVATTLMFAIQEGKIPSVDTLLTDLGWNMSLKDQAMTLRHLANMMSGYTRAEAPGDAWAYNDYGIQLYYLSIINSFNEGTGSFAERADTVMRNPNRLGFLQFEDPGSMTIPWNAGNTFRISTTVRDFARIGWFWLNKGNWNGTQLLPQSYFDSFMKPAVPGSLPRTQASDPAGDYLGIGSSGGSSDQTPFGPGIYGFNWWYNANVGTTTNLAWPDAPTDLIVANGSWDREYMVISPSLNLVAAAQGDWGTFDPGNPNAGMNLNFKLLQEAAVPPPDSTPPSSPAGLVATPVSESQIDLSWSGSTDPESGISSYNIYRDGVAVGSTLGLTFSDTGLSESTSYTYEMSAVNGVGLEGPRSAPVTQSTLADTTPPTITSVTAAADGLTVVFSEPVEQASATNLANYSIDNAITIQSASLGSDLATVTLGTSQHSESILYTLTVNNVLDRANTPNSIASNTQVTYSFKAELVIASLTVVSGAAYQVVAQGLALGAEVYIDRSYTFATIPAALGGATYIKTANDDKSRAEESFLSFSVNQDVKVYVAYDIRAASLPGWLSGWADTATTLGTTDLDRRLYAKSFAAGTVVLGGNLAASASGAESNYSVVIGDAGTILLTLPGMSAPVQDLDGDGTAEDVNGNSRLDFADVVTLYQHIDSPEVQDNPAAFDFNGNGAAEFADVVELFNLVSSSG